MSKDVVATCCTVFPSALNLDQVRRTAPRLFTRRGSATFTKQQLGASLRIGWGALSRLGLGLSQGYLGRGLVLRTENSVPRSERALLIEEASR